MIIRGAFGLSRIVILMLLARAYGAYEFGLFTLALTFMEITKVVSDLGVDIVSIRRFASEPAGAHILLESILGLKIVGAVLGISLSLILYAVWYADPAGFQLLFVACASVFTTLIINAFSSYYQTQLSMDKLIRGYLWGTICYFVFSILAIEQRMSVLVLMAMIPLTEGITLVLLTKQYTRIQRITIRFSFRTVQSIIAESIYVGISGIIVVVYLRLDNVMISRLLDIGSVGQYALAYRITEPFSLIFTSFGMSVYASLSSLPIAAGVAERVARMRKTLLLMLAIACLAIVSFFLVVRPILPWFSSEYIASGDVLLVLGFVLIFKAINTQTVAILNSMEKFRTVSVITCINLALSVTLNLILIPLYGIRGAGMAVVGTEAFNTLQQSAALLYYARRKPITALSAQ
jgi:O-antigen/teichoic acid export membrane protein